MCFDSVSGWGSNVLQKYLLIIFLFTGIEWLIFLGSEFWEFLCFLIEINSLQLAPP